MIANRKGMSQASLLHIFCYQGHGRKSLALVASLRKPSNLKDQTQ